MRFFRRRRAIQVQRVALQPGDVLLVQVAERITARHAEALEQYVKTTFPGHECLVLDGGMKLGVVGQTEAAVKWATTPQWALLSQISEEVMPS